MNKPIYFLLQHLKIGGVEICITNIANVLVQRGYKVFWCLHCKTLNCQISIPA